MTAERMFGVKKVRASYYRRCADYVKWLGVPMFTVDESLPDMAEGTHSAVEAMYLYETHGYSVRAYVNGESLILARAKVYDDATAVHVSEPRIFDALVKGKQCREFNIKQWMSGVKSGEFWPEEFLGCSGLRSLEEFRSIFGRWPSLPLLRIILQEVEREILRFCDNLKQGGAYLQESSRN